MDSPFISPTPTMDNAQSTPAVTASYPPIKDAGGISTTAPASNSQQALTQMQASGAAAPQSQAAAQQAINKILPATPTFYKPTAPVQGYAPQTVFNAQGQPLSYDQYLAAGGKADFSNVVSGNWPTFGQQNQQGQQGQNQSQGQNQPGQQNQQNQNLAATQTAGNSNTSPTTGNTPPIVSTAVTQTLENDPTYRQFMADRAQYESTANQQQSLMNEYTNLSGQYNIPGLQTQLLNMNNIINGTETDIRNEIHSAGGLATNSQVLALASARNKTLIQNYNSLQDTLKNAENTVNTMMGLASQDRTFAMQAISDKLNVDKQMADYTDKFMTNAKDAYNTIVKSVGYAGLYNSLMNSDPSGQSLTNAERVLGVTPGQLQQLGDLEVAKNNLAVIQSAGVTSPYVVTPQGEVWNTQTGHAYHSQQEFQQMTGMSVDTANSKGLIQSLNSTTNLATQKAEADIAKTRAETQAAQATTAERGVSTAKTEYELNYQQTHGGMTPQEVATEQTKVSDATQKVKDEAAKLVQQLGTKTGLFGKLGLTGGKMDWGTAWNTLHAMFPGLANNTIDNLLQKNIYGPKG